MATLDNYSCENQMTIFDFIADRPKITNKIRLIELFAGIGSQAQALKNIGADFEHHRVVEFDKYAIASYNAVHNTNFPTMDITKIKGTDLGITETDKYTYIMTYSFPCTDLSVAGRMMGMAEGSGTRSSLLWEVKRLLEETQNLPQILVMENVPQIHSKSNLPHFKKWIAYLESKGYSTTYQDLNAKNYGIAQSRNRTFAISILGDKKYKFPKGTPSTKSILDFIEEQVDEKYYLKNEKARKLIIDLIMGARIKIGKQGVDLCYTQAVTVDMANAIAARYDTGIAKHKYEHTGIVECEPVGKIGETKIEIIGQMDNSIDHTFESANRIYSATGIAPTIPTGTGGGIIPKILDVQIVAMRGRDPQNPSDRTAGNPNLEQRLEPNHEGIANTITTVQKDNLVLEKVQILGHLTESSNQRNVVYDAEQLSPTLQAAMGTGGGQVPLIVDIKQATKQGFVSCQVGGVADLTYPDSQTRRGRVIENGMICPTLTTENIPSVLVPWLWIIDDYLYLIRIRKLTPRECWRLMGFSDEAFDRAAAVNSNTQLYKQAGNSIVVQVLEAIFKNLIGEE